MARLSILLFYSLFSISVYGQDMSYSVGVVTISDDFDNSDHLIEFLNEDGSIWHSIHLFDEWVIINDFEIIAFKPDYSIFKIKCQEKDLGYFRVVVNEETGMTKRLLVSPKLKLQTWEEYVLDVFAIEFDVSEIPMLDKIQGSPKSELPTINHLIVPKEIKGEWMRVIWTDPEYPQKNIMKNSGWIKWKSGNKILVKIYHLS
ncbi:MAG: hypothetical protein ACI905_002513 [Roseivirga sp.]|jgi:hypothetical protein